jgi:hypothetical protein
VDGQTDEVEIAKLFASHFEQVCSPFNAARNSDIIQQYLSIKSDYIGNQLMESDMFDVDLINTLVLEMKNGKAAGLDGLTVEHIKNSHPIIYVVLCKLFNQCLLLGWIPPAFGLSYTVPIPKGDARSQTMSVNNFRGISINPVISKLFEMAVLKRFANFFLTSDHQFGFKRNLSCSHVIYSLRNVIDHYIRGESTVNLCMVDLSKAFDKMNHHALFIKLSKRNFPAQLMNIFERWFSISATCVKWGGCLSHPFVLRSGVRQGGVLSPYFFAIFVDDIVGDVIKSKTGCYISAACVSILLYADDIVLIAPSVGSLQSLLTLLDSHLGELDMRINASKSVCIRFGRRHDTECANLVMRNGEELSWVRSCRYLGAYLVSGRIFKCSFVNAKRQFYRSFNAMFGRVGRLASEEVILSLLSTKCLPSLLYAVEACPLNSRDKRSLDFTVNRTLMKLFQTSSMSVIEECQRYFNFLPIKSLIDIKIAKFMQKFSASENCICNLFSCEAVRQLNNVRYAYNLSRESTANQISSAIRKMVFAVDNL